MLDHELEGRCAVEDEFREITQNNGHYVVEGHSRSPISVSMESTYMRLPTNNSNLRRYFARFLDMMDYWSNFRCRLCLTQSFLSQPWIQCCKFGFQKLET